MFVLIVFLAHIGDVGTEHPIARAAGAYVTEAECATARDEWWEADRVPDGLGPGWFEISPGRCEPAALVG